MRSCSKGVTSRSRVSGAAARAADPRHPDWPCAQAKVPDISLAAVWAGPDLGDAETKWKDDAKVTTLVSKLSARKTPLDEAARAALQPVFDAPGSWIEKER